MHAVGGGGNSGGPSGGSPLNKEPPPPMMRIANKVLGPIRCMPRVTIAAESAYASSAWSRDWTFRLVCGQKVLDFYARHKFLARIVMFPVGAVVGTLRGIVDIFTSVINFLRSLFIEKHRDGLLFNFLGCIPTMLTVGFYLVGWEGTAWDILQAQVGCFTAYYALGSLFPRLAHDQLALLKEYGYRKHVEPKLDQMTSPTPNNEV